MQGGKKKLINISDIGDFSIEDAPEYFEESCSAIQNLTNFFQFGKQINQIKRLSIPDINDKNIDEEIPDEVSALNDPLENSKWLELYKYNVVNNLLNDLVKTKTEFANKTRSLKLIEPLNLQSEENKSDSLELIAKMTELAKEANLDIETIMQEQCNDTVIIDIKNCIKPNKKPERNKNNPYQEEKWLKVYIRQVELLFIEDQHDLLCIKEYNDDYTKSPKINHLPSAKLL